MATRTSRTSRSHRRASATKRSAASRTRSSATKHASTATSKRAKHVERAVLPSFTMRKRGAGIAEQTLKTVGQALHGLETSANYTYRALQELGSGSGGRILRQWQGWATKFVPHDLVAMAQSHRHTWERDLYRFADGVVKTVRHTAHSWSPTSEDIMREARRNICDAYRIMAKSPVMTAVKGVAHTGKEEILSFLNIPSQGEIEHLQRKLTTLEQRLTTVMLRGARNR